MRFICFTPYCTISNIFKVITGRLPLLVIGIVIHFRIVTGCSAVLFDEKVKKSPVSLHDCADIQKFNGTTTNGFYKITRPACLFSCSKRVLCDFTTDGGGWTVIQQRRTGQVDFFTNRGWDAYKNGFGNDIEFWVGNQHIHEWTSHGTPYQLLVEVIDENGVSYMSTYEPFRVVNEANNFRVNIGAHFGNVAVDNFVRMQDQPFVTYDRDTDQNAALNCATYWQSGWWFNPRCESAGDLNLPYDPDPEAPRLQGIRWQSNNGAVRLLKTSMKIRPTGFLSHVAQRRNRKRNDGFT